MDKLEKNTILLVEDDGLTADLQSDIVRSFGNNVVVVNTGEKAVKTAQDNQDIDLILMDINLGRGIDGTQAAENFLFNIC